MADLKTKLMDQIAAPHDHPSPTKVTVVGVGQVGMACAYSIMTQVQYTYMYTSMIIKNSLLSSLVLLLED